MTPIGKRWHALSIHGKMIPRAYQEYHTSAPRVPPGVTNKASSETQVSDLVLTWTKSGDWAL